MALFKHTSVPVGGGYDTITIVTKNDTIVVRMFGAGEEDVVYRVANLLHAQWDICLSTADLGEDLIKQAVETFQDADRLHSDDPLQQMLQQHMLLVLERAIKAHKPAPEVEQAVQTAHRDAAYMAMRERIRLKYNLPDIV